MSRSWVLCVFLVLGACGDNNDTDDDADTGIDPGQQRGELAMCGVEGPDDEAMSDCQLSGGGAFRADINGDSVSDLVIGAPYADVDGVIDAGAVIIFFGSEMNTNFIAQPPQILTQNMVGSGDKAEKSDRFGWSVSAVLIAEGRGKADLVVGVPYEDVGTLVDAGALSCFTVVFNSTTIVPTLESRDGVPPFITQDTPGIDDMAETGDLFGFSLAWGALFTENPNGARDLAIGVPGEDIDGAIDAGAVHVLIATSHLQMTGGTFLHQGLAGMNEKPETGDNFGWSIAAAQASIEGAIPGVGYPYAHLAIGVPGEDVGTIVDAGAVHVLMPGATGPTPTGSQLWTQDSPGIAGGCEPGDRFGEILVPRQLDNAGRPDLLVGVPHEDLTTASGAFAADAGMVHLIPAHAKTGLTATGSRVFTQADSSGSPPTETIEAGDMFGSAIGGFARTSDSDLVIGAPMEDLAGAVNAGVFHYLGQEAGAFPSPGSRVITIGDTPGHTPTSGDMFGFGFSSWNFGSGILIVGVPGKDVTVNGTVIGDAGAALFYQMMSTPAGAMFSSSARATLTATEAGYPPNAKEQFGRVMY